MDSTTVAIIIAAAVSAAATGLLGFVLIPWLQKLHLQQTILDIGPKWHKKKQGTPMMGGIMFIIGSIIAFSAALTYMSIKTNGAITELIDNPQLVRLVSGIIVSLLFSVIGFFDDYLKAIKHRNKGVRGWTKVFWLIIIAAVYLYVMHRFGGATTVVDFPFIGSVDFGIFYYLFAMIAIIGFVNSVNLTDGVDGLCGSVTFVAMSFLIFISSVLSLGGFSVVSAAYAGACFGYLFWNFYPAKVMMGDTGSFFLGGAFVTTIFGINKPMLVFLLGIVYLIEALSDIIQFTYFKLTKGKRFFKMAPIHHHFEMCGYSEIKIVFLFSAAAVAGGAVALLSVIL